MSSPPIEWVAALRRRWHRLRRPPRDLLWSAGVLWDLGEGASYAGLADWRARHPSVACVLWLGSDVLTDFVCEPQLPLRDPLLRLQWARRILVHYHGNGAADWSLATWQWRRSRGVTAVRAQPQIRWRVAPGDREGRIAGVRPVWPALLEAVLAARPALRRADRAQVFLFEPVSAQAIVVSCVSLEGGRLAALHRRRLEGDSDAALEASLRAQVPIPEAPGVAAVVGAIGLPRALFDVAVAWPLPPARCLRAGAGAADFLRSPSAISPVAWSALAAASVLLVAAAWDARNAWTEREQALALAVPSRTSPGPGSSSPVEAASGAANRDRPAATASPPTDSRTRSEQVFDRLNYRWDDVFAASEAASGAGDLAWLALEHERGRALRLQGVARDDETPRRAAERLKSAPAFRRVLLARLDAVDGAHAFELVAEPRKEAR